MKRLVPAKAQVSFGQSLEFGSGPARNAPEVMRRCFGPAAKGVPEIGCVAEA
jgi:hypothetical protein